MNRTLRPTAITVKKRVCFLRSDRPGLLLLETWFAIIASLIYLAAHIRYKVFSPYRFLRVQPGHNNLGGPLVAKVEGSGHRWTQMKCR